MQNYTLLYPINQGYNRARCVFGSYLLCNRYVGDTLLFINCSKIFSVHHLTDMQLFMHPRLLWLQWVNYNTVSYYNWTEISQLSLYCKIARRLPLSIQIHGCSLSNCLGHWSIWIFSWTRLNRLQVWRYSQCLTGLCVVLAFAIYCISFYCSQSQLKSFLALIL